MSPLLRFLCAAAAGAAAFAAVSCQSFHADTIARSAGEEEIASLASLEMRLLDIRLSPDPARLSALRAELAGVSTRPWQSRGLQARAQALKAEAALLAGDGTAARRDVEEAAGLSDMVEGVWVVRAALQPDDAKRLAVLETGIARAEKNPRLRCERGRALLKAGRYAEAAQDFDEGLRGLDPRYGALYGTDRDHAAALAQAVRETGAVLSGPPPRDLDRPISNRAMVERAFSETQLLRAFSAERSPTYERVLPALVSAGMLLEPGAPADAAAPRRSVGFFLWGIVARLEHNPGLLTRYRAKYGASPVPDVPAGAPEFDAVLGVVEREIMELPDGLNFRPAEPVSGLQYLGMLAKLVHTFR
jgi:tetratricopeptide (TPR) repeat protein